jgi:uridine phosphorylase
MSTGIGADNTEIAVVESSQIVDSPTFVRVGSSGGIQKSIEPGSLVITTGALAMENTSEYYVPRFFPAVADFDIVAALRAACEDEGVEPHVGLTATTSSFYGSQDRTVGKFAPMNGVGLDELHRWNVLNFEMEASCLFRLAHVGGGRAGAICVTFNNRMTDEVIADKVKRRMEGKALKVAMRALARL